ncbi:glycerophosphoryl diester phosphodiesterase [Actinomycetes bacterium]|nr:glycerophosphoryl diester phosphodiesterase [Actinomycetes bacterium]
MKIFAHRGFSHKYPEATRAAYEGAIAAQSDGLECDVRLTQDNQIVCFHDRTTKQFNGKTKSISKITLDELRQIADVITLDELLEIALNGKQDLLIETKHPTKKRGRIEREVIALLKTKETEIQSAGIRIIVMSFSLFAVQRIRAQYPDVAKVVKYVIPALVSREKNLVIEIGMLRRYSWLLQLNKADCILVWTVNSRKDLHWAASREIYGVITDRVARAKKILAS